MVIMINNQKQRMTGGDADHAVSAGSQPSTKLDEKSITYAYLFKLEGTNWTL